MILFQYGNFCQETYQSEKMPQSSSTDLNQDIDIP